MHEEWWEKPVCYLCDYWWILLLLVILAVGLLTPRSQEYLSLATPYYDITSVPKSTSTPGSIPTLFSNTSQSSPVQSNMAITPTVTSSIPTITLSSEFYGYINEQGGYAFNYPSDWKGEAIEANAFFYLPNQAKMEIVVQDLQGGETLEGLVNRMGPLDVPFSNLTGVIIGGESAFRYEVVDETNNILLRGYQVVHQGRSYSLVLFSPIRPEATFSQALEQFDQLVMSFRFLP